MGLLIEDLMKKTKLSEKVIRSRLLKATLAHKTYLEVRAKYDNAGLRNTCPDDSYSFMCNVLLSGDCSIITDELAQIVKGKRNVSD